MKRLLVSLLLVVSACGGASDSSSDSTVPVKGTTNAAEVDAEVQAVVDAIIAAHGEDGGFDAVIWAFERGYSGDQLFAGALEARLEADGVITTAGGGTETPDGAPLGLVALPGPDLESLENNAVLAVYRTGSKLTAQYGDITVDKMAAHGILTIVGAASVGYSGRQIIENIIEGGKIDEDTFQLGQTSASREECFYLRDATGQIFLPEIELGIYDAGCSREISKLADKEMAEREAAAGGDLESGAAGGDSIYLGGNFRARGPITFIDQDITVISSEVVVDFCDNGRVFASSEAELVWVANGDTSSSSSHGEGIWDAAAETFSVTGTWDVSGVFDGESISYSGEWNVEGTVAVSKSEVTFTDTLDQTIAVPITDEDPEGCD